MLRSCALVAAATVLCSSSTTEAQSAGAFLDCESARNFGANTARQFTSAVFNRVACNSAALEPGEVALAATCKKLSGLTTADPDSHKICYANGFYGAYVETLADEYAQCSNRSRAFASVSAASIARAAQAVFVGLHTALGGQVSEAVLNEVYAGELVATGSVAVCRSIIVNATAADLDSAASTALAAGHLADLVCQP